MDKNNRIPNGSRFIRRFLNPSMKEAGWGEGSTEDSAPPPFYHNAGNIGKSNPRTGTRTGIEMVGRAGIGPATHALKVRCSTN